MYVVGNMIIEKILTVLIAFAFLLLIITIIYDLKNAIEESKMITKEAAIKIALNAMPESGFQVKNIVCSNKVWYVGLTKNGRGFEVEIDAETGKIIGGGGGK